MSSLISSWSQTYISRTRALQYAFSHRRAFLNKEHHRTIIRIIIIRAAWRNDGSYTSRFRIVSISLPVDNITRFSRFSKKTICSRVVHGVSFEWISCKFCRILYISLSRSESFFIWYFFLRSRMSRFQIDVALWDSPCVEKMRVI